LLDQLAKIDKPIVTGEFGKYNAKKTGQQVQIAGVMQSQYDRQEARVTVDGMTAACEGVIGKPTPEVFHDLGEEQNRIAYNVIQSGAEKALTACMQFRQLRAKKQGLQVAISLGDSNIEDGLKKQIRDHTANINRAVTDYSDFLDQLGKIENGTVAQQFDEYTRGVEKKNDFQKISVARLMKKQYEQQRGGKKRVDVGGMDGECDALGKGTS